MSKTCQACGGSVCEICGGCVNHGECSCMEDNLQELRIRAEKAEEALRRIADYRKASGYADILTQERLQDMAAEHDTMIIIARQVFDKGGEG